MHSQMSLQLPIPCSRCGKMLYSEESIKKKHGENCFKILEKQIAITNAIELLKKNGWTVLRKEEAIALSPTADQ
jgi:hypothetical protein